MNIISENDAERFHTVNRNKTSHSDNDSEIKYNELLKDKFNNDKLIENQIIKSEASEKENNCKLQSPVMSQVITDDLKKISNDSI